MKLKDLTDKLLVLGRVTKERDTALESLTALGETTIESTEAYFPVLGIHVKVTRVEMIHLVRRSYESLIEERRKVMDELNLEEDDEPVAG